VIIFYLPLILQKKTGGQEGWQIKDPSLRAKRIYDFRIALFRTKKRCMFALKFMNYPHIFCRRLIVFQLPSPQGN
jgi:hypothetical protein